MNYNISTTTSLAMPTLGKGTECIKLLLTQASKDMHEPLVPMLFPSLGAHLSDVEFMYSDNKYYELCGQMGHLIGPSGIGKDQLHDLVEAIMRSFRDHALSSNNPALLGNNGGLFCVRKYFKNRVKN